STSSTAPPHLPSFPTRRSSDLSVRKTTADDQPPQWRLKLIAVDVTKRRLLVLPDDLVFYREPSSSKMIDPDEFKISRAPLGHIRSEEHTSELQSRRDLVCRLLL